MSSLRTGIVFCGLLVLLSTVPLRAQLIDGSRLAAIEVVGTRSLSKPQVIDVLGLQIGAPISVAALEAAAQRLGESGLVSEVTFRYTFRGKEVTAIFTVVDAEGGADVLFDNFPWWTDDELKGTLAEGLPGFDGRLSGTGTTIERATAQLTALLGRKGIAGRVEYLPFFDNRTGAQAHLFRLRGVSMPICALSFTGVEPTMSRDVEAATSALIRKEYSRVSAKAFLATTLQAFYRKRGYLRAELNRIDASLGAPGQSCAGQVQLMATVAEGHQYRWKSLRWTGAVVVPSSRLEALLGLRAGDTADGEKLDAGLKEIARAYGRHGYLALAIEQHPTFDDVTTSVTFDMVVKEGPQFRMGKLIIEGISAALEERMRKAWTLQTAAVYDADYLREFIKTLVEKDETFALVVARLQTDLTPVQGSNTVDVTLRLPR